MIEGDVSAYVNGAYAVAVALLAALTVWTISRGIFWAKRAKELERKP